MGYTSATYHLNFGLSRTEKRKLDQELNSVSFSASLDAGSKGNKKRMEIFVKYWSEKRHKVVEMFFGAVTLNVENAISVTESFLGALRSRNIKVSNLVNLHTDSCSVLRGKVSGAIKRISEFAPQILTTDIGGDILHHIHNAVKKAFSQVFSKIDRILKCIKYDIRASPAKIENYLKTCDGVGDSKKMPASYCSSRFLDRYKAIEDTLEHLDSYKEYYASCQDPKTKHLNVTSSEEDSYTDSDASDPINIDSVRLNGVVLCSTK